MSRLLRRTGLSLWAAALLACTTTYHRAEELAKQGRFVEAATLFEQLSTKDPQNRDLVAQRDRARWRALERLLTEARTARREGDGDLANGKLESFLSYRERWGTRLNGALESSLEDEVTQVRRQLEQQVASPALAGSPLQGEQVLRGLDKLLAHAELKPVRQDMEEIVARAGRAACERTVKAKSPGGAHWAELVFRYCQHWQHSAEPAPELPETLAGLNYEGSVLGVSGTVVELLRLHVTQALERSPWFSRGASRRVEAQLGGEVSTSMDRAPVRLTSSWMETVPYVALETQQEAYQEPYTEMEMTEEQEPYQDSEGGQPVTRYRKVMREKAVTKQRLKHRTVVREVTRYRQEPRVFSYVATKVTAEYRLSLALRTALEPVRSPVVVVRNNQLSRWDYAHDVTFPSARVYPQSSSLPLPERWVEKEMTDYGREVEQQLSLRWRESFCAGELFTVEAAARCVRSGTPPSFPVKKALEGPLLMDAAWVHVLFR